MEFNGKQMSEAFKLKLLSGPKAVETSYTQCKHTTTQGGNFADPSAELLKLLGHIEYATEVGTCGHCHLFEEASCVKTV